MFKVANTYIAACFLSFCIFAMPCGAAASDHQIKWPAKIQPDAVRGYLGCAYQEKNYFQMTLVGDKNLSFFVGKQMLVLLSGERNSILFLSPYDATERKLDDVPHETVDDEAAVDIYKMFGPSQFPPGYVPPKDNVFQILFRGGEDPADQYLLKFSQKADPARIADGFISNGPCKYPCDAHPEGIQLGIPASARTYDFGINDVLWPRDHSVAKVDSQLLDEMDSNLQVSKFFIDYKFPTTETASSCPNSTGEEKECIVRAIPITKEGIVRNLQNLRQAISACLKFSNTIRDSELTAQINEIQNLADQVANQK